MTDQRRQNRGRLIAVVAAAAALGMVGMAYAAVPLYRIFCQVTGYGGTTQIAGGAAIKVGDRVITVRFNGDVQSALPWRFRPAQGPVRVRVGEPTLAYFHAENRSDKPLVGTATYNVTPQKVGAYFAKIDCFCFTEQYLAPHAQAEMPVTFYVDPEIVDDPDMDDVTTITLSYMFFNAGPDAVARYEQDQAAGSHAVAAPTNESNTGKGT